jgi:signal transduction histidine kinase
MRSLAFKIFLCFWLSHAILTALLLTLPNLGYERRVDYTALQVGRTAAAMFEASGPTGCSQYLTVIEQRNGLRLTLSDNGRAVCQPLDTETASVANAAADGSRPNEAPHYTTDQPITGPSQRLYSITGAPLRDVTPVLLRAAGARDVMFYGVIVSGGVCFPIAWYLAAPVRRVRDASRRLAAGDLHARAGATHRRRYDEIGQLVRDFDTMADRLERLVDAQRRLLSDISHELRSPLARLRVALELARRKSSVAAEADLARIELEAQRMDALIGHLLTLARTEDDGAVAHTSVVSVADVVEHVVSDADYEANRLNSRVDLQVASRPTVTGDPELITSALENVVRNALRHTGERSVVEILVDQRGTDAVIEVRDHGPGVPETDLEHIFAPFYRVGASRARDTGGVGLGLAIARRAIQLHSGTIAASNALDGGLRVTISLPTNSAIRDRVGDLKHRTGLRALTTEAPAATDASSATATTAPSSGRARHPTAS